MKHILLLIIALCTSFLSCGQQQVSNNEFIASVDGYNLTENHFNTYLKFVEEQVGEKSTIETQIVLKSELKEAFLKNPATIVGELDNLKALMLGGEDTIKNKATVSPVVTKDEITNLAQGHKVVRQVLGNDIGQMQFSSNEANTFRQYVANSLLSASTGSFEKTVGGSGGRRSTNKTQFCANGTYIEALSGSVNLDVEGAWAGSHGTTYINGYWDVATLPNGMMIIVMYSTHPYVLEDWPNGIIPFVVTKHGADFVALPGGELYRRTPNQYCN
jgi:hypothetical protein